MTFPATLSLISNVFTERRERARAIGLWGAIAGVAIFLITQYFQFVRGYGPLSTGVRLLPVALSVGIGSVAGTQLAVRAGTKLVVTTGLVAMAETAGQTHDTQTYTRPSTTGR